MLRTALDEEVADYIERHSKERDENGRAWWFETVEVEPKVTMGSGR
jgi:hypothetical protein